jgi:hypothetical protein
LNAYNTFTGDPGFFTRDFERYRRATREGLAAAAAGLTGSPRVALSVVPHGRLDRALPGSVPVEVS